MKTTLQLLALALGSLACSKGAGGPPSCAQLADHVLGVLQSEMDGLDPERKKALTAQLAAVRSELIEDCEGDPSFLKERADCLLAAKDRAALETCGAGRVEDTRLDKGAPAHDSPAKGE